MEEKKLAHIIGTGSYLPERILSNSDLEKMVETTDEWIVTRTGMKERRLARADEFTSDMGIEAAKRALVSANRSAEEIDLILVATCTPDYLFPSTAALIQAALKATKAGAFDFQVACTGFIYGLAIAKAFIESGMYKNILVIASEKISAFVDYTDRSTCVLFGDGAAAAVVSDEKRGFAVREACLGADGEVAHMLVLPAGGCREPASHETVDQKRHFLKMDGKETFKHAVRRMESALNECLEKCHLKEEEIHWLVPHQANLRIVDALAKRFNIDPQRVYKTGHKYGNTSASTVAIALDELLLNERVEQGENIVLVAFGAGFTWGSIVLTKV